MDQARRAKAVGFQALLWVGLILLIIVGLVYAFWGVVATPPTTSLSTPPAPRLAPTLTPGPTPKPLPAAALPTPSVPLSLSQVAETALPGRIVLTLTPAAEAVGWASNLDGRTHFDVPNIHAGFFKGHVYYGAIQFDLSAVPPGSTLTYAALQLAGLDEQNLHLGGSWQLDLLDPAINAVWPELTYELLHQAALEITISPTLTSADLGRNKVNLFSFGPAQLAVLQQHLVNGQISFRLDGPTSAGDNLFTWDSGYHGEDGLGIQPVLQLVVILPAAPDYVVVTSTPTPENLITAAALAIVATQVAETSGTYTPVPANWVTPVVVTPQPTPANAATAAYQAALATAEAILSPTPVSVWTATPTPIFILLEGELATPWATLTPTATPQPIPTVLVGKIAFLSNRSGGDKPLAEPLVYLIDPDGSHLAVLTDRSIYDTAVARDSYSADQRFRAFVKDADVWSPKIKPALFFYDYFYNVEEQMTLFGAGIAYEPAWSPTREQIAFVSNDSGNDEIWVINRDGSGALQLTRDLYSWWDKHPSWSPDGSQIVFWSNRTGQRQIWVMNADGSNLYSLSRTGYDDWNPVWIKYTDPARNPVPNFTK
ncbi:MAG: PD40 domain-containing protein [Chloroflexi bacterium]|nr:PD40 domain-containing protein [Chloroflexota bacterium]